MSAKTLKQNNRFTHHNGHMKGASLSWTVQYSTNDRCKVTLQQAK